MTKEFSHFNRLRRTQLTLDRYGQTLTAILVNDGEYPERFTIARTFTDEVVSPDVILMLRSKSQAPAVTQPQSSTLRLTRGNLESFLTPDKLDSLAVDSPSLIAQ